MAGWSCERGEIALALVRQAIKQGCGVRDVGKYFPGTRHGFRHMAMGQNPVPPVNIPLPTKIGLVVHLPQNGTIGFDRVKIKPPGYGPQVVGVASICQVPFWGYPIFDPHPSDHTNVNVGFGEPVQEFLIKRAATSELCGPHESEVSITYFQGDFENAE